ncbi:RNF14, partial [Symbiodinium pilosum]
MAPNEAALEAIRLVRAQGYAEKVEVRPSAVVESVEVDCPGGPYTCFICTEAKDASERFLPH